MQYSPPSHVYCLSTLGVRTVTDTHFFIKFVANTYVKPEVTILNIKQNRQNYAIIGKLYERRPLNGLTLILATLVSIARPQSLILNRSLSKNHFFQENAVFPQQQTKGVIKKQGTLCECCISFRHKLVSLFPTFKKVQPPLVFVG